MIRHMLSRGLAALVLALPLIAPLPAAAHTQSYGFLHINAGDNQVAGRLELAVRDLDTAYGIDANGDGRITWGELRAKETQLADAVFSRIAIGPAETPCDLTRLPIQIDVRGGENYVLFPFTGTCEVLGSQIRIGYDLMFDIDAQHRGLVDLRQGDRERTTVMTPDARSATLDVASASLFDLITAYVSHGAHHIWSGYDHMLFLTTLLLSAVLIRRDGLWAPVNGLGEAFAATFKVVTAFTLAHSITLSAAALGVVELPSIVVESAIAASVAVAAVNNLMPIVSRRIWVAAFVFGLLHGFGFASVLTDLGLPPARKIASLFAFNLGVELGQLTVVAILLPVLFVVRNSLVYRRFLFPVGSTAIAVIGVLWLVQRSTGTSLIFG